MQERAYAALEQRFARITALGDAEAILHWDLATMMPKGGAAARADQLAVLKSLRHGLLTAPEVTAQLAAAANDDGLDAWQRANVDEMRRAHAHATALPAPLVEALSRATTACEAAWREARALSAFTLVLPTFETLLGLVREAAAAKADALGLSAYDALLDEYEPGARSAAIDVLFAELTAFLPDFLDRVVAHQAEAKALPQPQGPFPIETQRTLAVRLMQRLGFDFDHGRLDVSLHPFCGGTPDDVRITTRYDDTDFRRALMGVLHETGHALYQRGLPRPWRNQPVGTARGMVLHESQSLLMEMQVCRSHAFLGFAAPLIRDAFGGTGAAWDEDALYRHYTMVAPGPIRVDADEVSYPLHVILRYELEQAMLAGSLVPVDLPEAWNAGMERLLGLRPADDRQGCLQDIHWYDGAWGYFPTYTLGAIAAAQIFSAACAKDAAIPAGIGAGNFAPLAEWLKVNIHERASSASTDAILVAATGRPLDLAAFTAHLQRRYLP